jgi:hypothetical protein
MSWHADAGLLARWADGHTDIPTTLSIEAHLQACGECRARVPGDASRLRGVWNEVLEVVDAPRPTPVEVALTRLGVREEVARLLVATPSLRGSWLTAVALVLGFAVLAARIDADTRRGAIMFLTLAPILPPIGVAVAYGPLVDPAYELTVAAPIGKLRLLLLRALAVLTSSVAMAALAAAFLPAADWEAVAWLLPACALTALTLAIASHAAPTLATALVTIGWLILVALFTPTSPMDRTPVFGPTGQAACALLLAASVAAVALQRRAYDGGGRH